MKRIIAATMLALPFAIASIPTQASALEVIVNPRVHNVSGVYIPAKKVSGVYIPAKAVVNKRVERQRWVPGHWERRHNRRVWIRGYYERY